jgi:hypothetical protein
MKKQTLAQILKSSSDRRMLLSVGILSTVVNGAFSLSVNAQGYSQDSFLPPEVIPASQAINYNSRYQSLNPVATNTPAAEVLQTPQEARQALYHSLMGTNIYPQFNGQSINQNPNFNQSMTPQNMAQGMSTQGMPQGMPQTWTNQISPQDNMSVAQNTIASNAAPPQAQTLSGNVAAQNTSQQRTTGGISHATGVVTGMGMNLYALANMRSAGGAYSAGLLGASMVNYGLRSGFRF